MGLSRSESHLVTFQKRLVALMITCIILMASGVVKLVPLSSIEARRPDVRGARRFRWGEPVPAGWVRVGDDAAGYWARPRRRRSQRLLRDSGRAGLVPRVPSIAGVLPAVPA